MALMPWRINLSLDTPPRSGQIVWVEVTDTLIVCHGPSGLAERVAWRDLTFVLIECQADVVGAAWVLVGRRDSCTVPLGAPGEVELRTRLFGLKGFDRQAVAAAQSGSSNARWACWERQEP
jgi:hypothetical protein